MNIVITGASKGIGYETTKHLAEISGNKIIAISRNEEKLLELKNECNKLYPESEIIPIVFDLEEIPEKGNEIKEKILQHLPHIDILINNAGLFLGKPFEDSEEEEIRQVFNINFFGPALFTKLLISNLGSIEPGHVVNIGGMGGYQGSVKFPGLSFYSASKAAIANLTECLAEEYKEYNISFNCLAMGAVNTEMLKKAFPGYIAPVEPDQMGKFIAEFAISGHKYFNGKVIPVSLSTP